MNSLTGHHFVDCPKQTPTCLVTSEVLDSIGHTPLIRLRKASEQSGCEILAKAEFLNPSGSIKDRLARHIVLEAERRGELRPGSTIVEVSSGNTGISLAMVGAMRGYKVRILLPKSVSREHRQMILSFGAEVQMLHEVNSLREAIAEAEQLAAQRNDVFLPRQFANLDNIDAHRTTTGPEILRQMPDAPDAFVMGVGTAGTIMGVGRALREAGASTEVFAVEPDESAVMSGEPPGSHGIQGLADGFLPELLHVGEIDEVIRVKTEDAMRKTHELTAEEGLLVGISSGANVLASLEVAKMYGHGHTIVTVLCDRGERYLRLDEP